MSPSDTLQTLRDLDRTSPLSCNRCIDFLGGNEYRDVTPGLQGEFLAWLVDYLDNILSDIFDPNSVPFREPLDELRRICGIKNVLPKAWTLSDFLLGCVYEGRLNGSKVRIRRARARSSGKLQKVTETFHQGTVVWKRLTQPNIVPLLGATIDPPQLISDRMPSGDLTEYTANYPDTNRTGFLSGVAEGLRHLHSGDIIHGNLQGANILVDDLPVWKHLTDSPLTTDERVSLIAELFSDQGEIDALKALDGSDAQSVIDVIDKTLDSMTPWLRRKCLATLCKICSHHVSTPRSIQIPLCYDRAEAPRYQGGFAEVWKGEHKGMEVAVKVLKVFVTSDPVKIRRRFCREVLTWKALRHENVLPLLGVTMSGNQFAMVSEWMANGNINEFVKMHMDANRFKLLGDVARGLIYMHSQVMVHGDLKGTNIMIGKGGNVRLADFGLLTIVSNSTHPATTTSSEGAGTLRWMSPELLDPERFGSKNGRPTEESDCYALEMVILEVLTGRVPFPCCSNLVVMRKIIEGEHPNGPKGPEAVWFTDDLWGMLKQCWLHKPKLRPTVEGVLEFLEQVLETWEPLSLSADSDSQADSDDDSASTMSHHPSGEVVLWDDDAPPGLSQYHFPGVDAGQGSQQPSPEIQQQSDGPQVSTMS